MKRGRRRKPVRRTAATRNAAVTDVRLHKPALTDARLTAVKAAAAMSARPVTVTTVVTGRRSLFRPMPAAQLITTTARVNARPGPAIPITTRTTAVVNTMIVRPHRLTSHQMVTARVPTAVTSALPGPAMAAMWIRKDTGAVCRKQRIAVLWDTINLEVTARIRTRFIVRLITVNLHVSKGER